jgi:LysR family glycine cleavage system transcriptional activator
MIPRVADLKRKHPEIELRLDASMEAASFTRSDVDLAIRYGQGNWPGLHCEPLIAERLIPVCSLARLEGPHPLKEPADLAHHILLRNDAHREDWPLWLKAARLKGIDLNRGPRFGYSELLLRAASEGLGVAVARRHLVETELKVGRLVAPFDISHNVGIRYWLVCPRRTLDDPRVATFRKWLLAEAGLNQATGPDNIGADA